MRAKSHLLPGNVKHSLRKTLAAILKPLQHRTLELLKRKIINLLKKYNSRRSRNLTVRVFRKKLWPRKKIRENFDFSEVIKESTKEWKTMLKVYAGLHFEENAKKEHNFLTVAANSSTTTPLIK